MSLYVAYGSNLNVQQMSYRCPGATVAFTGYLINWKLLYRGSRTGSYATVKKQKGSRVPVAVWNIDSKNEKALDLYEGYPRFYKKRNVFVQLKNGTRKKAMIYLLPDSATAGRPSSRYVGTVLQGYKDMGFDTDLEHWKSADLSGSGSGSGSGTTSGSCIGGQSFSISVSEAYAGLSRSS